MLMRSWRVATLTVVLLGVFACGGFRTERHASRACRGHPDPAGGRSA